MFVVDDDVVAGKSTVCKMVDQREKGTQITDCIVPTYLSILYTTTPHNVNGKIEAQDGISRDAHIHLGAGRTSPRSFAGLTGMAWTHARSAVVLANCTDDDD